MKQSSFSLSSCPILAISTISSPLTGWNKEQKIMYIFGTLDLGKSLEIPELSISCLHAVKTRMFSSFPYPSLKLACWSGSTSRTFFFLTLTAWHFKAARFWQLPLTTPGLCVSCSQEVNFLVLSPKQNQNLRTISWVFILLHSVVHNTELLKKSMDNSKSPGVKERAGSPLCQSTPLKLL